MNTRTSFITLDTRQITSTEATTANSQARHMRGLTGWIVQRRSRHRRHPRSHTRDDLTARTPRPQIKGGAS